MIPDEMEKELAAISQVLQLKPLKPQPCQYHKHGEVVFCHETLDQIPICVAQMPAIVLTSFEWRNMGTSYNTV